MQRAVSIVALVVLWSCGPSTVSPDSEDLSALLSIGNLVKLPIQNPNAEGSIIGLEVSVDIINTGVITIDVPFTVTWSLLDGEGRIFGTATNRIDRNLASGDRERVTLSLSFPPTPSLSGFQDAVIFDLVPL